MIEAALTRAVEGWLEPIVQGGQVIGQRRRYSDGLLRDLLRAEQREQERGRKRELEREAAETGGNAGNLRKWVRPRTLDEVRDSILGKLEAIEQRRCEEEEERAGAEWARWQRCWGAAGTGLEPARLPAITQGQQAGDER